jgi:hypothetical protein
MIEVHLVHRQRTEERIMRRTERRAGASSTTRASGRSPLIGHQSWWLSPMSLGLASMSPHFGPKLVQGGQLLALSIPPGKRFG